jgi:hypothetical protein
MIDIWANELSLGSVDFRIAPKDVESVRKLLLEENITDIKVIIADVQDAIDLQLKRAPQSDPHQLVLNSNDFFESYHTLDEIQKYIDDLADRYPTIVEPFSIGKTHQGRIIRGIHIKGNKSTESLPEIVFHGGIHAREWIGPVRIC